jgi:hypothetical protein
MTAVAVVAWSIGSGGRVPLVDELRASDREYRATATFEVVPAASLREMGAEIVPGVSVDEKYLDTQLCLLTQPEPVLQAVKNVALSARPEFRGKSDLMIAHMIDGRIECVRRPGLYLVDVSVTGADPETLPLLANALATYFRDSQRREVKKLRDSRKARLDEEASIAESGLHLSTLDRQATCQGSGFSEITLQSDLERLVRQRGALFERMDALTMQLIDAEVDGASPLARETLEKRRAACQKRADSLVPELEQAAGIRRRIDQIEREAAAYAQRRADAQRGLEAMAQRSGPEPDAVVIVAPATEAHAAR